MRMGWIVPISVVLAAACATPNTNTSTNTAPPAVAPEQPSLEQDVQALDAIYATFSQAYEQLNPDLVADLYTEDAIYLSPRAEPRRGRDAIRASFARMFENTRTKGQQIRITFDRYDRAISGDLAYEVGYYTLVRTGPDQPAKTSRGKFTVIFKRQPDGRWLFHVDIYNPAPPPTPEAQDAPSA